MKITKDTLINDIMVGNFMSNFIFHKYKMDCCKCNRRYTERLEDGAILHNVDIDLLLNDLNKLNFP